MIDDVLPPPADKPRKSPAVDAPPAGETQPPAAQHPAFQTPEQVAASEPADGSAAPVAPRKTSRRFSWRRFSKKQRVIILAVAAVVVIGGGGTALALVLRHQPAPPAPKQHLIIKKLPAKKPAPLVSTLTGLPIASASVNQRPVTGVMIENSLPARPQSGLDQAGVVFEAVAEAGITRFLVLYQDTQPSYLGPVRSLRPYFLQWDLGFDAPIAHVGGSPEALSDVTSWQARDLDQFYNGGSYERITSREAPHNVYTSATQLNALETSKGFTSSNFTGWPRKADSPSKTPNASAIDISPSSPDYASSYAYNASTDSYERSEGGQPHMEINENGTQTQIAPKVVIAMVIPQSQGPLDASDAYYTEYATIGSGQAYVFQDGTVTIGTWSKASNTGQISFTDAAGKVIKLNAGQTWLTAVGSASDVTYK